MNLVHYIVVKMEERASDEEEREQMRKKVTQLHSRVKDLEAG